METEKQNVFVYIRGVAGRGEEVINTLTELGGDNHLGVDGARPNWLYYINSFGTIESAKDDNSFRPIWLKKHYTEIFLPKPKPKDKELVWCWDYKDETQRILRFYDAINNCTFGYKGERNGIVGFENYEPYEGEYPQWAKEALTKLED